MLFARYQAPANFASRVFKPGSNVIRSATSINSSANLESNLLPYRGLPTLRKAVLHTDRFLAARAASFKRYPGKRCTQSHAQRRRFLDSKELPELPQAQSIPPRSYSQGRRLRTRHNHKLW
jgi:hypothetical protein